MTALSKLFCRFLEEHRPDWVLVTGDVNATLAAARAAQQAGVPLGHVEAGLRSFDPDMPEEYNRIATDALANIHFVSEPSGIDHLRHEGIAQERIHFVGNVMIDTLHQMLPAALTNPWPDILPAIPAPVLTGQYFTATLHRPSNVDNPASLRQMLNVLRRLANLAPVIFPVHPRTAKRLTEHRLQNELSGIHNLYTTPPLGYLEFIRLMKHSTLMVTDSGGIQEESTWLGVPCLTLRANTERPVTIELGTNVLAGDMNEEKIMKYARIALAGNWKKGTTPPLWDGFSATRIANTLKSGIPPNIEYSNRLSLCVKPHNPPVSR
jgi:UDP-N-acetylglucosamine 2-epimerase (non-hydrolysing)